MTYKVKKPAHVKMWKCKNTNFVLGVFNWHGNNTKRHIKELKKSVFPATASLNRSTVTNMA